MQILSKHVTRALVDRVDGALEVIVDHKTLIAWLAGAGVVVAGACWMAGMTPRSIASRLCDLTKTDLNDGFRQSFNHNFAITGSGPSTSAHSHPRSAELRTSAERSIDSFISTTGCIPYSISTSARDSVGQRLYYTPKDLDLSYKNATVTENHVLRMIDVDYYADIEAWLWTGRPLLMYTFVPETVGGEIVEGTFYITDDHVNVLYTGGAVYKHRLWDYNVDHFVIRGKTWCLMVKVDQVKMPGDAQRRVVLLTPTTWYWRVFDGLFGNPQQLRRRRFRFGGSNIATYLKTDDGRTKCMVSLTAHGSPSSASIQYKTFVGICLRLQESARPNMADVERMLAKDGVDDSALIAPILFSAWKGGWYEVGYTQMDKITDCGTARNPIETVIEPVAPHFQATGPLALEDGNDIGVQVWSPIVTGSAVFPRESYNNDAQAVAGRVDAVRNTVNPAGCFHMYMREFIDAFPAAELEPVSFSEAIERQNKPLQVIRNRNAMGWFGHQTLRVKAFMKKESYPKVSDPRNISTCTPSHTVELSTYTYAAKEHLKTYDWFTPCLSPKEIADRIRDVTADANEILSCDYSRLDGTISKFLRQVEMGVYLRLFKNKYRSDLRKLLTAEANCKAATATGMRYSPGYSRLSGSPLTTDGNTIIVAFVAYCAARKQNLIKAKEIALIPALVYGDDKIVAGIQKPTLETCARGLGLTLKCKASNRGQPVEFLSRIFVDPWTTSTSVAAPKRALGKMHLSVVRNVDPRIVARHKANGYIVTDSLTPLISDYCNNVIDKTANITELHLERPELARDSNWWADQWSNDSWPQDPVDSELMEQVVATDLEITVSVLREKIAEVRADRWTPLTYELPITIPAVLTTATNTTIVEPTPARSTRAPSAARSV